MDSEKRIIKQTRTERRVAGLNHPSTHKGLERTLDQLTYLYNSALEERKEAYKKYKKLKKWGLSEERLQMYFYPQWEFGTSYNKKNRVKYLDTVYEAVNRLVSNIRPCDDPVNWRELTKQELKKKSVSYEDQAKSLTEIRNDVLLKGFNKAGVQGQQRTLKRVDKAYSDYIKGLRGSPRYKNSSRKVRSFETYTWGNVKKGERRTYLTVKGVGRISFRGSIPEGTKYIRILRTALRVEIQFIYETIAGEDRGLDRPVGMDLGVRNRIALSDGSFYKGTEVSRKKDKRKQRAVSRAEKSSNGRKKKIKLLGKEHARTAMKEHNKVHRLTTELSRAYNFVISEDLRLRDMSRSAKGNVGDPGKKVKQKSGLNRSLREQQLGKVLNQLEYKVKSTGGKLIRNPAQYTSQTCSECGYRDKRNRKGEVFKCVYCGHKDHADTNAAINICNSEKTLCRVGQPDLSSRCKL